MSCEVYEEEHALLSDQWSDPIELHLLQRKISSKRAEGEKHVLKAELLLLILCFVKFTAQMHKKSCKSSRSSVQ